MTASGLAAGGAGRNGVTNGGQVVAGQVNCVFSPKQQNVTSYVYVVNNAAPVTVSALPDGTANVTVLATTPNLGITMLSQNAAGDRSDQATAGFTVVAPLPA